MKRDSNLYHSRYNPEREASRFLDSSLEAKRPSLAILIGPGLNYLGSELKLRLPGCHVIALQPCSHFDQELVHPADRYWSPSCAYAPDSVIQDALSEGRALGGVCVLEWEPLIREYPHECDALRTMIKNLLSKEAARSATSSFWARRWLRNCGRFVEGIRQTAQVVVGSSPIIIACAGPSLERCIPFIKTVRDRVSLWSLASAHASLNAHNLEADALITSDPGLWSGLHARTLAAGTGSNGPVLFATPSAYLPTAVLEQVAIVPFETGMPMEEDALALVGLSACARAASGTASGSAAMLALQATSANVYLCGLDLASLDYRDHAQGYAFWSLDQEKATRLGPTYSIAAGRVYEHYPQLDSPWRLSRAFSTYAHELSILFANEKRLVRVEPSALGLTGNTISADMLSLCARGIKPRFITQTIVSTKPHAEKLYHSVCKRACTALENAVARTVPVDAESSTELFALGGKALASAIALAARGELGHDVLTQAITALQSAAKPLDSGASV